MPPNRILYSIDRKPLPVETLGQRDLEWPLCGTLIPSLSMHAGRRGDFLGQASLGWEQLELLPGEASREMSLTLGFRDDAPKRDQELVQGTVQVLVEAPVTEVRSAREGIKFASRSDACFGRLE